VISDQIKIIFSKKDLKSDQDHIILKISTQGAPTPGMLRTCTFLKNSTFVYQMGCPALGFWVAFLKQPAWPSAPQFFLIFLF
jgi:hypothetical protein